MAKLSEHFHRDEFACKCGCGFDTVDAQLLAVLEHVRAAFNAPVVINSSCRCAEHNKRVGGGRYSQHLLGRAADIVVSGIEAGEVYDWLCGGYRGELGIGRYKSKGFTHVDTRRVAARWSDPG